MYPNSSPMPNMNYRGIKNLPEIVREIVRHWQNVLSDKLMLYVDFPSEIEIIEILRTNKPPLPSWEKRKKVELEKDWHSVHALLGREKIEIEMPTDLYPTKRYDVGDTYTTVKALKEFLIFMENLQKVERGELIRNCEEIEEQEIYFWKKEIFKVETTEEIIGILRFLIFCRYAWS
jgi:hypothetical protein